MKQQDWTSPPSGGDTNDSAVLRAVRAFLLDDASFALSSESDEAEAEGTARCLQHSPPASHTTSDSSGSSDTGAALTARAPIGPAPAPSRPRQINRSRVRLKCEIAALRQQAIALNARLTALQSGQSNAAAPTPQDAMVVAWKTIALDQRAQREVAETERENMREVIKEYKIGVKRIRRFLKNRLTRLNLMAMAMHTSLPHSIQVQEAFDDIARHFDAMHTQIDTVFDDARVSDLVDGVSNLSIQHDMTPDMTAELRESRVMPFDAASTAAALWSFRQNRPASVSVGIDDEAFAADDGIHRKFHVSVNFKSYQGVLHGLIQTRRFVDGDRHILLHCTSLNRATRREGDAEDSFGCRFLNWTVVRPLHREPDQQGNRRSACQIEICEVVVPFRLRSNNGGYENASRVSRELRDFSVEGLSYVHQVERQMLENLLLDRSRQRNV